MAKKFLKNTRQIKKDLPVLLTRSAIRGGGFLGAKVLTAKGGNLLPEKLRKHTGPLIFLLGTALECTVQNPELQALGQGIAMQGVDDAARAYLPESAKAHMGLEGIGADGGEISQDELWEQWAREAEAEAEAAASGGDGSDENVSGVETDEILV